MIVQEEKLNIRNHEGYIDLTAYDALSNVGEMSQLSEIDKIANEANWLLRVLKYIIRNAGFELIGRIALRHKKSGQEFR